MAGYAAGTVHARRRRRGFVTWGSAPRAVTITTPAGWRAYPNAPLIITGTASRNTEAVDVYADGVLLGRATGTEAWSYTWTPTAADASVELVARASNDRGELESAPVSGAVWSPSLLTPAMWHDISLASLTTTDSADPSLVTFTLEGLTRATGQADSLGGTSAVTLTSDSTNGLHRTYKAAVFVLLTVKVIVCRFRRVSGTLQGRFQIAPTGSPWVARFRADTGEVLLQTACTATVTDLGGGWYEARIVAPAGVNDVMQVILLSDADANVWNGATASIAISFHGVTLTDTRASAWGDAATGGLTPLSNPTGNYQPLLLAADGTPCTLGGYAASWVRHDENATSEYNKSWSAPTSRRSVTNCLHDGTGCTWVGALQCVALPGGTRIMAGTGSSAMTSWQAYATSGTQCVFVARNAGTNAFSVAVDVPWTLDPTVWIYRMIGGASPRAEVWRNETQVGLVTTFSGALASGDSGESYRLGRAGTVRCLDARWAIDAVWPRVLIDDECRELVRYCRARMGVA